MYRSHTHDFATLCAIEASQLGKLPAELRNSIWEIVIVSQDAIEIDFTSDQGWTTNGAKARLAITELCRQACCETLAMFWNLTTFRIATVFFRHINDYHQSSAWRLRIDHDTIVEDLLDRIMDWARKVPTQRKRAGLMILDMGTLDARAVGFNIWVLQDLCRTFKSTTNRLPTCADITVPWDRLRLCVHCRIGPQASEKPGTNLDLEYELPCDDQTAAMASLMSSSRHAIELARDEVVDGGMCLRTSNDRDYGGTTDGFFHEPFSRLSLVLTGGRGKPWRGSN